MSSTVLSNRVFEKAIRHSRAEVTLPWPTDRFGPYGASAATGNDIDSYVQEQTGQQVGQQFDHAETGGVPMRLAAFAGRDRNLNPVVVLVVNRLG